MPTYKKMYQKTHFSYKLNFKHFLASGIHFSVQKEIWGGGLRPYWKLLKSEGQFIKCHPNYIKFDMFTCFDLEVQFQNKISIRPSRISLWKPRFYDKRNIFHIWKIPHLHIYLYLQLVFLFFKRHTL